MQRKRRQLDVEVPKSTVSPAHVLSHIYGKTSVELDISEKRRDEIITSAIFAAFRNQEFGTHFKLPKNYKDPSYNQDARGVDMVIYDSKSDRLKQLQVKGVYIQRAIARRMRHSTRGVATISSRRMYKLMQRDSEERQAIMQQSLEKIIQDYSGISLLIYINADLATQTSLEIAIQANKELLSNLKAKEVWILRNIPVRTLNRRSTPIQTHSYQIFQIQPYKHTYSFCFSL